MDRKIQECQEQGKVENEGMSEGCFGVLLGFFKVWQKNTRQGKVLVGSFCLWQKKQGEGKLVGVDKVFLQKNAQAG